MARHEPSARKRPPHAGHVRLVWLALAVVTVGAYAPALSGPFLFDDAIIESSTTIHRLWPPSDALHPTGLSTPVSGRPVVNYSLALNYAFNSALGIDQRPDPHGPYKAVSYRALNVLLHLACGLLLFGVIRRTLRGQRFDERWALAADPIALGITAIWLLHPIQTEAVDYVIQRTEIIVSLCYLGTLYASLRAWDSAPGRRWVWYALATLSCLLGMGSKEVMISAPLMVVLYDRVFRWPSWRAVATGGRAPLYAALFATTGWLIVLMVGGPRSDTVGFHLGLPWYRYLYSQAWAILHYVRLVFWPNALNLDYGTQPIRGWSGLAGVVVLSVFGLATAVAWTRLSRWGWFAFLGSWFFLLLAPSSSIVPITTEIAAERRIYLALAAVLVLVAVAVDGLWRLRRPHATDSAEGAASGRHRGRWARAAVATLAVVLATATFQRSRTYQDDVAMWRDVVAKAPDNPRGYQVLSTVLLRHDSLHDAEPEALLRQAVRIDTADVPAYLNLEYLETRDGRVADAEAVLRRVLAIDPDNRVALARLGVILQQDGEPAKAVPYLEREVALGPSAPYLIDLGIAYADVGRLDDAAGTLRRALAMDSTQEVALNRLGAVLIESRRAAEAIPYLETAVRRQPGSGLSLALLSRAYAESGHLDDAAGAASYAATRVGNSPEALTALGNAELALGKRQAASEWYRRALAARPGDAAAREGLARAGGGR